VLVEADSAKVVTDRRLFGVGLGRAGEWPLWFEMMDICMAGADEDDMQIVREGQVMMARELARMEPEVDRGWQGDVRLYLVGTE